MNIYTLTTNIYLAVLLLSLVCIYISYKYNYSRHLKFFSILLVVTCIVEWMANYGRKWMHFDSNIALYNVFMLVEFCAYALYYKMLFTSKSLQRAAIWFIYLYPVFWLVVVFFVFGLNAWNSYLSVTGSLFTICMSAAYYYQLFTSTELVKLTKTPEFWIATGMIMFYTCELPYLGMLNFLVKHYLSLAEKLSPALTLIDTVMYSLFIYAYLCGITMKKS